MKKSALTRRRFVIAGWLDDVPMLETRATAASALALSLSWQHKGYSDVRVTDAEGKWISPEGYRNAYLRKGKHRPGEAV